jgi:hypothetical protein
LLAPFEPGVRRGAVVAAAFELLTLLVAVRFVLTLPP